MTQKPVIVIVDDEIDIREALGELMELDGHYEVLTAASGEDALAILLDLRSTPPDLLITDYRMPRMDGLELLGRVKQMVPDLPAVMVTAFADVNVVVQAAQGLNVARFLTKPVQPETLLAAVQDIVGPRWLAKQRAAAFDRTQKR
jgi:two-component system, NtrC family, response regulator HydG